MNKTVGVVGCTLSSIMIGYFANELNTTSGTLFFSLAIGMLIFSSINIIKG